MKMASNYLSYTHTHTRFRKHKRKLNVCSVDGFKSLNVTELKINGQKKETTGCCTNASSNQEPKIHGDTASNKVFAVCLIRQGITEGDIPAGPVSISG